MQVYILIPTCMHMNAILHYIMLNYYLGICCTTIVIYNQALYRVTQVSVQAATGYCHLLTALQQCTQLRH